MDSRTSAGAERPRGRGRGFARHLLLTVAALLATAGTALAVVGFGLQNPSFENNLDNWTATVVRDGVYAPTPANCPDPNDRRGVCVISGSDSFTVRDGVYTTPRNVSVAPVDGTKMVRLGGPFTESSQNQAEDRYILEQTFVVDPAKTVLDLNYNIFTWDYTGFDSLRFRATLTDANGGVITEVERGSFGSGVALKTTGWRSAGIDLAGYENQQVHLKIDAGGTEDDLFGFWVYVDAGLVAEPPVGTPGASAPNIPNGGPVTLNTFSDPGTGQTWFAIPNSQASQFPAGCVPLTVTVPIDPGSGVTSNVRLLFQGASTSSVPMDNVGGNSWRGTLACAATGELFVEYTLTEDGTSQTFLVPIGGVTLIDPQGVVHDKDQYDAAIAAGQTPEQARATAAISGATVRLQRRVGGTFVNVLSGDPGISPKVNPQITGANGLFQWDVSDGAYRVIVTKAGYPTVTSRVVDIPPPVLDLHIAMQRPTTGTGGGTTSGETAGGTTSAGSQPAAGAPAATTTPTTTTTTTTTPPGQTRPCAGLRGQRQALCRALLNCAKLKGKRKGLCERRARAVVRCQSVKNKKKRAACLKKARKIGAPQRKRR